MSFKNILRFNLDKRWIVLGFFILITILSATQLPKLRFEFSPEAMLEFSDEEIAYQEKFNEKFHSDTNLFLIVFSDEQSIINPDALSALRDLTNLVEQAPGVVASYSLAKVPDASDAGPSALLKGSLPNLIPDGLIDDQIALNVKKTVENSHILTGNLISDDEKFALITVSLDQNSDDPDEFLPVFNDISQRIDHWKKENQLSYQTEYGGLPYIRAITVDTMKREQFILWPVVGLLYIIALIVVFRSFWQAVLPLLCIGCVILWAIAVMVLFDMPVTMINNTLPLLILVIGVTNGIYVIMRILDERRKGKEKNIAIVDGVHRVALATLLTTATTSIGFGSLLIAKTKILNAFGGITAFAVMLIYVAIIFFMPQVLSLTSVVPRKLASAKTVSNQTGSNVVDVECSTENIENVEQNSNMRLSESNGESNASNDANVEQKPENKNHIDVSLNNSEKTESNANQPSPDGAPNGWFEKALDALTAFVIRHRFIVIAASVVLLVVCLAAASQIRFNSKVNDVFMDDHPITVTNKVIEDKLGGMLPVELDLVATEDNAFRQVDTLAKICQLENQIKKIDGVLSALSLCDLVAESGVDWDNPPNQAQLGAVLIALNRLQQEQYLSFLTADGANMHISLRIPDNGYENDKKIIANIAQTVEIPLSQMNVSYKMTGIGYNSTQGLDHFMSDLFSSLLTAFLIIFGLLFFSFRSFWSGAVAILPNLIPIAFTMAILPVYGFTFNTTSVLVFTISVGLSVDNSIHIIQRFRQEFRGNRTVNEALRIAVRSSGRAIVQSNVLLCAGLAILLFSNFDPVMRVGALTVTTIAAALAVSVLLIPAEISCVGKYMQLPKFRNEIKKQEINQSPS